MSYPPPPPGYGGPGYAVPKTNTKSVWSLVLGILGIICCGLLCGIPALILGNIASKEIALSGGAESGAGMAQAGRILGIISIVLSVVGVIIYIVFGVAATQGGGGYTSP